MNRSIIATLFALGLAGCSAGPPTTYLTLAPTQGTVHRAPGPPVAVAHVQMPSSIDRIYLTSATGANTLHVAGHVRWAAPLAGSAQEVLARDLATRLPGRRVLMPGDPPPPHALTVYVNVTQFMPHPGHVVLDADWQVTEAGRAGTRNHGRAHIIEPSGDAPASRARAMSIALGDLADTIAGRLSK